MSSRERWIIYPLLFFAFCLAARDQLPYLRPGEVKISHLLCDAIEAKQIEGNIMVAGDFTGTTIEAKKRLVADGIRVNDLDTGTLKCERLEAVSPSGVTLVVFDAEDREIGRYPLILEAADAEKPADDEPDEAPAEPGEPG